MMGLLAAAALIGSMPSTAAAIEFEDAVTVLSDAQALIVDAETLLIGGAASEATAKLTGAKEMLERLGSALENQSAEWVPGVQRRVKMYLGRALCMSGEPSKGLDRFRAFKALDPGAEERKRALEWEEECRDLLPAVSPDVPLVSGRLLQTRRRASLAVNIGALGASALGTSLSLIWAKQMYWGQMTGTLLGGTALILAAVVLPANLVSLSRQARGLADGRRFDATLTLTSAAIGVLGLAQAGLAFSTGDQPVLLPALVAGITTAAFGIGGVMSGLAPAPKAKVLATAHRWVYAAPPAPVFGSDTSPGLRSIPRLQR
ncbi:MAG: hypothetical protein GY898_03800 [Proteobacteria bacterium]|nr:hypothetical protein [Pseudomonadota bacterium]